MTTPRNTIQTAVRRQVFDCINSPGGASYDEIADELGIKRTTARDHVASLRDGDIAINEVETDGGEKWFYYSREQVKQKQTPDANTKRSVSKSDKSSVSKRLNEQAEEMETKLNKLLQKTKPAKASGGISRRPGNEDVVVHATDDHVGDVETDEFGNVTYNTDIWFDRRKRTFDKAFYLVNRQKMAGYEFDTFHLLLGGDTVTGEGVYPGQSHGVELSLPEQIEKAAVFYTKQIRRASKKFDSVQVVCQSGNHGELNFTGSSKSSNADRLAYLMLTNMVRQSDMENVSMVYNDSTNFTNFEMRGHNAHLRHGDDSLEHIGTSSAKKDWRNWRDKHQFDVAYRGHYHMFEIDTLTRTREDPLLDTDGKPILSDGELVSEKVTENVPVIMTGSTKPPSGFEESIAEWSQPAATIHGVSDDRPVTWLFPIDFDSQESKREP